MFDDKETPFCLQPLLAAEDDVLQSGKDDDNRQCRAKNWLQRSDYRANRLIQSPREKLGINQADKNTDSHQSADKSLGATQKKPCPSSHIFLLLKL